MELSGFCCVVSHVRFLKRVACHHSTQVVHLVLSDVLNNVRPILISKILFVLGHYPETQKQTGDRHRKHDTHRRADSGVLAARAAEILG